MFKISLSMWKWTFATLVLLLLLSLIPELISATIALRSGERGSLGVTLEDQAALGSAGQNSNQLRITALLDSSPLHTANAQVGDILRFTRPIDRWRKFKAGESIPVTLIHDGRPGEISIAAIPVSIPESEQFDYIGRMALSLFAVACSLFIGLMGAKDSANRLLAMTFIALGLNAYYAFNYSSGTLVFELSKLANLATNVLIWFGGAAFCLSYRNEAIAMTDGAFKPTWRNDPLMFLFRLYCVVAVVVFFYSIMFGLGYETPGLWELGMASVLMGLGILVGSLIDGWKRTTGEIRERHLWILGSASLFTLPSIFSWFPQLEWAVPLSFCGQFLMYVGMLYSVMQHRVLNFSFALSRTLILSVITLLLYTFLEVVKYLVERYMQGSSEIDRKELLFALVLFLAFQLLHRQLKDFLERWLLRRWYNREQRLRKFARDAPNFTSIEVLLVALVSALDKFTDGAKSAVYMLEAGGSYKLKAGNIEFNPPVVNPDDGVLVALQSDISALDMSALEDASLQSVLTYELAIPMTHRGHLNGFVLLGRRGHSSSYRPDQVAVLSVVVQQIGLTLFALRVATLESELLQLQKRVEQDSVALQLMSGRRKAVRDAPNLEAS